MRLRLRPLPSGVKETADEEEAEADLPAELLDMSSSLVSMLSDKSSASWLSCESLLLALTLLLPRLLAASASFSLTGFAALAGAAVAAARCECE